ncbi:MAG TPA: hypothetical protein VD866_09500 [Urbifossiella sp.]|nr:hypothetical protein [Urbifossiella sp.]
MAEIETKNQTDTPPAVESPAAFLSPECERIVQVVFDRGPVAAKVISRVAKVDRTRCYVLLADLRARGLIRDDGDGYELATLAALPSVIGLSLGVRRGA